jgi:uncharacterized membrane protein YkoI
MGRQRNVNIKSESNNQRKNMNINRLICSLLVLGLLSGLGAAALAKDNGDKNDKEKTEAKEKAKVAKDESPMEIVAKAKLTRKEAEKIALAKVPKGKIKAAELEMEDGILIWAFDVAMPGTDLLAEVEINAVTGTLVTLEIEAPEAQAKEAKAKAKDAIIPKFSWIANKRSITC